MTHGLEFTILSVGLSDKEAKEVIAYLNTIIFLVIESYDCINYLKFKSNVHTRKEE